MCPYLPEKMPDSVLLAFLLNEMRVLVIGRSLMEELWSLYAVLCSEEPAQVEGRHA